MGKEQSEYRKVKGCKEMVVWMEVSHDRYELPLVVANSAKDLAKKCGTKESTVKTVASRANTGNCDGRFCRYRKIKV